MTIKNLLLIAVCWLGTCGTFFLLIIFIKYLPGNAYITGTAMGFSCFGYMLCDPLNKRFSILGIMSSGYLLSGFLLVLIMFCDSDTTSVAVFALLFFFLKFTVCVVYSGVFVAHVELFDPRILSTSYGLCGIFAKSVNIFIPILAEAESKTIPLLVICSLNFMAFLSALLLRRN